MSLQGFEDSHINERESNGESGQFSTEQKAGKPDHILMQGTMQFYEDLLDSLHDTYIVVFNPSGKHIEVWGSPLLKNKFNVTRRVLYLRGRIRSWNQKLARWRTTGKAYSH